uniref:SSD domain-containing protein n=1 Tax=Syphacia muris TaxID=451379 RepID=A0A0N5AU44_9BILA
MCWEGPNIAILSLIIILAYSMLFIQSNFAYTKLILAAAIAVLLIFTLFFFSVFLLISGRRECKGLKWYQIFRYGDENFPGLYLLNWRFIDVVDLHDKLLDAKESFVRSIGKFASTPYMRCPIAFVFQQFYGYFRTELHENYFLDENSEARAFLERHQQLFSESEQFLELVFHEPVDYSDTKRKEDILSLLDWAVRNRYASKTMSWLKDFTRFETSTVYDITSETFTPIISHVFLNTDHFKKYQTDIVFDKFETQIVASRMYLELTEKGVAERFQFVFSIFSFKLARTHEIPLYIKAPFAFSIQHDIMPTMLLCFGVFVCCVCVLTLLCYGIPALTTLVVLSDISVMIGVIGYATYCVIPLNIATFSVALCGNVLTTATAAYFCYNYTNAGKLQRNGESRVQYSFQLCLIPVTFASLVPLITYLPLLSLSIPLVMHVFKMLLLTSLITYLLLFFSVMMFFAEQIPAFCSSIQSCFDVEEDSGSIYYVPTNGTKKIDVLSDRYFVDYAYMLLMKLSRIKLNFFETNMFPSRDVRSRRESYSEVIFLTSLTLYIPMFFIRRTIVELEIFVFI